VVGRSPLIVVDGAHNEQGVEGLAETLLSEFPPAGWVLVMGVRGDRDLDKLMGPLRGLVERVIATQPADAVAIPAEDVASVAADIFGTDVSVEVVTPVSQAITEAIDRAGESGAIVVTGSLYVVGEALARLKP
jgi:dihydrofolate synthase/folylpolyglutamate synthase